MTAENANRMGEIYKNPNLRYVNVNYNLPGTTYDGNALSKNTFTNTALVSGHVITCSVSGSITNFGSVNNVPSNAVIKSGSTSVTAKKLGRHYVGVEMNEQYCVWAEKRLEMAELDMSIQGYTDGVFWERNTSSLQNAKKKGDN